MNNFKLSEEQKKIIDASTQGENIFVDAVIGAGKTTLLREICFANADKNILYLTYNKLLKEDARTMIILPNTEVQNYHGFVYKNLTMNKKTYTNQNGIKDFIFYIETNEIPMPQYDLIVVDEYQDINDETAQLLRTIDFYQDKNPQLIFVGDLKQKIYDTTTINVISDLIFKLRSNYLSMDLTQCFRISKEHARKLGNIWGKKIQGINSNQRTIKMDFDRDELIKILNSYENKDILILTPFRNNITLNQFISYLELTYPEKYNKTNLYITIGDGNSNSPVKDSMIVTTFDGSKGMERELVIVFGWNEGSLGYRSQRGNKEIVKNLFLVAASRGKKEIIFIEEQNDNLLTEKNFEKNLRDRSIEIAYKVYQMYNFVYDTELQKLYNMLEIEEIKTDDNEEIKARQTDFNILLTPAIHYYQQAIFFKDWNYETILESFDQETPIFRYVEKIKTKNKKKQVLLLTALVTNLTRYANQAMSDFMDKEEEIRLIERLYSQLSPNENINIKINKRIFGTEILGMIDVLKDDIPWVLEFTDELEKKHFIQAATYAYMLNSYYGMVWNLKTNKLYKVTFNQIDDFEYQMIKTIRKV